MSSSPLAVAVEAFEKSLEVAHKKNGSFLLTAAKKGTVIFAKVENDVLPFVVINGYVQKRITVKKIALSEGSFFLETHDPILFSSIIGPIFGIKLLPDDLVAWDPNSEDNQRSAQGKMVFFSFHFFEKLFFLIKLLLFLGKH